MLVLRPADQLRLFDSVQDKLEDEIPHYLVSGLVSVVTRNPLVGIWVHAVIHTGFFPWYWDILSTDDRDSSSRGGGGPSAQSQTPPSSSKSSPQARASAQGGKAGALARSSQRGS